MAGGAHHVTGQKSAGSLAGHFDSHWPNLWSRNSHRKSSRCPRLHTVIWLVLKVLYNSEKKRALQIVDDLDHRDDYGKNLICFSHVAKRTPIICMIKKLDRLLINWILNSNQILYDVIILSSDNKPSEPCTLCSASSFCFN